MLNRALLTILVLIIGIPLASAFYVTPVLYTSPSNQCNQVNSSYLICPDGSPITVAFSVATPYAPVYGNFTAYPTDFQNQSFPVDFYGNVCSIPSSSTKTCFITLVPISPFAGNGTVTKNISIRFVSSTYPQVSFVQSFNVTVQHSDTAESISTISQYDQVNATYMAMDRTYDYMCTIYQICNESVAVPLAGVHSTLLNASALIANSLDAAALQNVTQANKAITQLQPNYTIFVNSSNRIVNYDIRARYDLANASLMYSTNSKTLSGCASANSTRLQSEIMNLSDYPLQNTLNGSEEYANVSASLLANETGLVKTCSGTASAALAPKISLPSGMSSYWIYIVAVVMLGVAIFAGLKYRDRALFAKIEQKLEKDRTAPVESGSQGGDGQGSEDVVKVVSSEPTPPPEDDSSKVVSAEPAPQPAPQPQMEAKPEPETEAPQEPYQKEHESLEMSFDSWLREHIGKSDSADKE